MVIEGNLKELSLPSIIQLNCAEMNTAEVSLNHQGREGVICFAEGAIIHATVGDLVGEEAVYELLTWPEGSFTVETGAVPSQRTISTDWNRLLLEGMRRIDEQDFAAQPAATNTMTALARNLKNIAGVEGVVIISRDGIVMASDLEGDAEKEGAVAVFVGNAAVQVGEGLNLTPFDWGLVTMSQDRTLILERPDYFVGLLLGEKASPALIRAEAARVMG
jgi:predicted regulator of Ras-like GTPase activity (Roadblock/LC7/MglB family)